MIPRDGPKQGNPWQLIVIGCFFLLGAVIWLLQSETEFVSHFTSGAYGINPHTEVEKVSPRRARAYGTVALIIALVFFWLYLKLRVELTGRRWWDFGGADKKPNLASQPPRPPRRGAHG